MPVNSNTASDHLSRGKTGRGASRVGRAAEHTGGKGIAFHLTPAMVASAMVGVAMVLGGGGSTYPITEWVTEAAVALLSVCLLVSPPVAAGLVKPSRWALLIGSLVLFLPMAQLVPLPPQIWHALPGRNIEVASLALIGRDRDWMPLSVAPASTWASMLAMIVPVVIMLAVSALDVRGRVLVCWTIAGIGGLSVVLGILQLSSGPAGGFSLYARHDAGYLVGFQASRNAQTDVLKIALMAAIALIAGPLLAGRRTSLLWIAAVSAILLGSVSVVLTGSRTGIVLLPVLYAAVIVQLWPPLRQKLDRPVIALGLATFAVTALLGALSQLAAVQRMLDRFALMQESRYAIWADTRVAIGQVWPWGGGIGSFPVLFNPVERLETVNALVAGRAHSDWLEWVLEAGLPGLVVLAGLIACVSVLAVGAVRRVSGASAPIAERGQVVLAVATLIIVALHAIDDYPFRSIAYASLVAVAAGFLTKPAPRNA